MVEVHDSGEEKGVEEGGGRGGGGFENKVGKEE